VSVIKGLEVTFSIAKPLIFVPLNGEFSFGGSGSNVDSKVKLKLEDVSIERSCDTGYAKILA
jgi:hypothetical protein